MMLSVPIPVDKIKTFFARETQVVKQERHAAVVADAAVVDDIA